MMLDVLKLPTLDIFPDLVKLTLLSSPAAPKCQVEPLQKTEPPSSAKVVDFSVDAAW